MRRLAESVHEYAARYGESPHVTEEKIRSFALLPNGWHYGEGVAYSDDVIRRAVDLHRKIIEHAFYATDAFPGLRGQILVTVYYGDQCLEFGVEPDGSYTFCSEVNGQEMQYADGLLLSELVQIIRERKEARWKQSGSSSASTGIAGLTDFKVVLFKSRALAVSRSSTGIVYADWVAESVNMQSSTTQRSQVNPSFSGASQPRYFLPVAG